MNILHMKIAGEYRFVRRRAGEVVEDSGWMPNLVTDAGLNRLGSTDTPNSFFYCSIGTGTTTPANSDTALVTYVAHTPTGANTTQTFLGSGGGYASVVTKEYTFAQGAVVGNMAEVGVGWNSGGSGLFSRARIVDGAGVPTTLTVVALDQLTVFYRLTVTPTRTDVTGSTVIDGVTYNWTSRFSQIASRFFNPNVDYMFTESPSWMDVGQVQTYPSTSTLGADTSEPSGTGTNGSVSFSKASYTSGNFYRDVTITMGPAVHNPSGGIRCMQIYWGNSGSSQQIDFGAAIPKDNTKQLVLTFRYSWGR